MTQSESNESEIVTAGMRQLQGFDDFPDVSVELLVAFL